MSDQGSDEHLDRTFFALSDRTRRGILARLAAGEASVSELAAPYAMSLPAILKHLNILRDAGLISEEKDGRVRRCRLDPEALARANAWIAHYRQFWEAHFDKLAEYLDEIDDEKPRVKKKRR